MADPLCCAVCTQPVHSSAFCSSCGANFCDKCWGTQIAHQSGRAGDSPHEKSDPHITLRLQKILTPATDPAKQKQLHLNDSDTTWLRYFKSSFLQEPELLEHARYKKLMQDSFTSEWKERWPQLVSFIGQTGDGKSTVIRMLIESQMTDAGQTTKEFPTPVVGGIGTSVPTSADIHLYADPDSYYTQFPRIYADCEGLTGGERAPMANRAIEVNGLGHDTKKKAEAHTDETYLRRLRELSQGAKRRKLEFATDDETRKREYTVREFYPRLMYTFSHVVVFVLANERTFETGLIRLLDWAGTSIESATNQSVLPHAIVVLNKSHSLLKDEEYDIEKATTKILSDANQSLSSNPDIVRHVRYWSRDQNKRVKTAKDLLKCYYSSFKVVRIPEKGRYMLIDSQVRKLQDAISSCCRGSHQHKVRAHRDLNADELGECLQSGLDHFTKHLYSPFDFLAFNWSLNPIPPGFAGNILRLALLIHYRRPEFGGKDVFQHLSHMLASRIMLDYTRERIRGTPLEVLEHYKPVFDDALEQFCDLWWPCSYVNNRGKKCVNTRDGHARGHQDERGRPLEEGDYYSNFASDSYRSTWHAHLKDVLLHNEKLMERRAPVSLHDHQPDEAHKAAEQHLNMMNEFYQNLGGAKDFQSNVTCLSCLRDMPEHPLPCGHIICSLCVRTFGETSSMTTFSLSFCPLETDKVWGRRIQISLKPTLAGVRALSLDGGGVRGIVELQVLLEIERELGGIIPIQDFFDLIVGTSTGGIIALGLGVQNWSVQDCIHKFTSLCGKAFTEREFSGIPVLEQLATANHQSKYKTAPLEAALTDVFGTDLLFGGQSQPHHYARNVAVTTTTGVGSEPRILTNYNRPMAENPEYTLERPDRNDSELKIWEAARATSAAPPYFKTFHSQSSKREFIDGAAYHNNPIKVAEGERMSIWPDVDNLDPDILLSIGTGKPSANLATEPQERKTQQDRSKWMRFVPKVFRLLFARMDDILDPERAWQRFYHGVAKSSSTDRYVRINPELSTVPPALDEKDKLWSLQTDVMKSLVPMHETIRGVADRLLASCFYFEKANVQPLDDQITGEIRCRFENGTENLRNFGSCLRSFQTEAFSPRLNVTEVDPDPVLMDVIEITPYTVEAMMKLAKFSVPQPRIHISSVTARTTIELVLRPTAIGVPTSGFPRQLGYEDEISQIRQKTERQAALRRSQSQHQARSLGAPSKSTGSVGSNTSRMSYLYRSEDHEHTRSGSAPAPLRIDQADREYPESPDMVAAWTRRLPDVDMPELDDTTIERLASTMI